MNFNLSQSNKTTILLVAILLLAALLRLPALGDNPRGFYCDEASVGYDAYSVLHTLRDQYGNWLPLYARSFGDYDEFLYRYLTVPAVAAFGLNEFATRLPAAIAGLLTVVGVYFLGKKFWGRQVGLLVALLLAVSPWHVQFSRIAFRAILFPLFFCAALAIFLIGLRKPRYLFVSAIAFAVSLYTYSSARVFVPLFLIALVIFYHEKIQRHWRYAVGAGAFMLLLIIPAVLFWFTPEGMARAAATVNFSLLRNLSAYASYFSPQFLFLRGDALPRHNAGPFGELYPFEMVTVLVGIVTLLKPFFKKNFLRVTPRKNFLLLSWLILYPLPAALTDSGTALRSIIGAPLFALISALGFYAIYRYLKKRVQPVLIIGGFAVLMLASVSIFTYHYYEKYPQQSAAYWQYGMRDAINYAEVHSYQQVWVSDQFFLPHIFILFYTEYPPEQYQAHPLKKIRQNHWFYTNYTLGKYHIGAVDLAKQKANSKEPLLLILPVKEYNEQKSAQSSWHLVKQINDPADMPIIMLVEVNSVATP